MNYRKMVDVIDYSLGQCPSANFELVSTNDVCTPYQHEELHQVIARLSPEQPFLNFDLRLSVNEISLLNQMHINSQKEYTNFGELQNLNSDLKFFIEALAPENDRISSPIAELIAKLANDVIFGNQQGEAAWIIVRSSVANNKYDMPDWHTDPCMAEECKENENAVIFTLKGPSTIFHLLPTEKREEFNFKADIQHYTTDNGVDSEFQKREELARMINISDATSANFGQGAAFLSGSAHGAVHTVPPIHEERLFIAIFIASKEEIKKLEEDIKLAN